MVRTYKKKFTKGNYTTDSIQHAIFLMRENGMSSAAASSITGVSRRTIFRYLNNEDSLRNRSENMSKIFSNEEEHDLAQYMKTCSASALLYGLTRSDATKLAYDFLTKLSKPVPKSWEKNKSAGVDWLRSFLKRNNLSLRTPEATSLARARYGTSTRPAQRQCKTQPKLPQQSNNVPEICV